MGLETGSYIDSLVATNPLGTDGKNQGDDHLRLIKNALKNCFAGFTGAVVVTGTDGGAVNAYTLTTTPSLIGYTTRMIALFSPTIANTGAATINISGLGTKPIVSVSNVALTAGDLVPGTIYSAAYDGTSFRLLSITKNYADQLAFSATLPAQAGNAGKYLRTDGTNASWQSVLQSLTRSARTSNTMIVEADRGTIIDITSGSFTQTFDSPANLPNGWYCLYQNSGTGEVEVEAAATITASSVTSNSISAGTTWTVATGLAISAGQLVNLRRTADPFNQRITGTVASYVSGTGVLTVTVATRIGSGTFTDWTVTVRPATAGIDSLGSYSIYSKEIRWFYSDGTAIRSFVVEPYYLSKSASFQWVNPPGYDGYTEDLVGGGGGGGSGSRSGSANPQGGAPGGAPARLIRTRLGVPTNTQIDAVVGAAGTGGIAQTVDNTAGIAGTVGGNTTFGPDTAFGGAAGVGGAVNNTNAAVTSGSGIGSRGSSNTGGGNINGGLPSNIATSGENAFEFGGAGIIANSDGGNSVYGGAASGSRTAAGVPLSGSSLFGVPAGGCGGRNIGGALQNGGTAGVRNSYAAGGLTGGTSSAGAPTAGQNGATAANDSEVGGSGSGGGAATTAAAAAGGAGGFPGGAGGGGGSSANGFNSGPGANGAGGRIVIKGEI